MVRLFPLLLTAVLLSGCERPFIEPAVPSVELVSPEALSAVRSQPELPLAVRASTSFGAVGRVEANGVPLSFDASEALYRDTLELAEGLNRIVIEAFGEGDTVGADTLFALYLPAAFTLPAALQLPEGLGGHATVQLDEERLLLTGGARAVTAPAQDHALLFSLSTSTFSVLPHRMVEARAGHATSLLPDGRVLVTGGSRQVTPLDMDDLVTTVELFDPATGRSSAIPVVAADGGSVAPVQRTEHTVAVLQSESGQVNVYLYGGIGNRGAPNNPVLGPLPFMRRLRFEDEEDGPRLVVPDRGEGFRFTSIARHTQTPLAGVGPLGFGRYLIAGISSPDDPSPAAPFELRFEPSVLDAVRTGDLFTPRIDHAAAPLRPGLTLVAGGRAPEMGTVYASGEVFADEPGVSFFFPPGTQLNAPRWGHTATNLGDDRILLVGGFSPSGQALPQTELFVGAPNSHHRAP
jgi:hypothetical protein